MADVKRGGIAVTVVGAVPCGSADGDECAHFLREYPEWVGEASLGALRPLLGGFGDVGGVMGGIDER